MTARWSLFALLIAAPGARLVADDSTVPTNFRKEIQPILVEYCYDCHGDGMDKGKVAFDGFKSDEELLARRDLWHSVLKNLRAGLMPPEKKPKPTESERRRIEEWIKRDVFDIDPRNPDPGRVTIRRLNRIEYRNTIRDLMGFDYKVEDELPPDDTGFGFDNIGDVLTLSPLLLEKYMQAAETITAAAVPRISRTTAEKTIAGGSFRGAEGKGSGDRMTFYDEAAVTTTFNAKLSGGYRFVLELEVLGQFDFDPGRCQVAFKVDGRELWQHEFGWQNNKKLRFEIEEGLEPGERRLALELKPLTPVEKKKNSLDLRIGAVRVQGPLEERHWIRPKNFELFFSRDVPATDPERQQYAREVLGRFARRAYRRPVDEPTLDRLVAIAKEASAQPGSRFEDGIAQAMIPVLASPRFLFRVEAAEGPLPAREGKRTGTQPRPDSSSFIVSLIDEHSLASRLSYFLWSTMPDDELFELADRGELRRNLDAQVKRMLADPRSGMLIENFVGQWLQVRDVEGIDINARAVLARDAGEERDSRRARERLEELRAKSTLTPEEEKERQQLIEQRRRRFGNRTTIELDRELRRALRLESELAFAHVLRENRSVRELIDSDYTFLNERLARHYGITNVTGGEMQRVTLPEDHPRGGVLTHGATLIVTSNPTRTSPVKRGLFILDNILGMPPPPPPADIPQLEESEKEFKDRDPTLREVLEVHRGNPLCSSCHNRMDPLGLALEQFNALGMWREKERGQPIDAGGRLITGETFSDVREVKRVLATRHQVDFYRCLTEKLLTYALGRGLEYYDVQAVDGIVERLQQADGRCSALLMGIVESAPFQKRRNPVTVSAESRDESVSRNAQARLQQ